MTTTQAAVLNLYNSVRDTALTALILKLSLDDPSALNEMFSHALKLVDSSKMPLDEDMLRSFKQDQIAAVSKKYPALLEKLNNELDEVIKKLIFPQKEND